MLIDVKHQKNGTLLVTAPDQTVYAFDLNLEDTKEAPPKVCERLGKTILQIITDPEQPELTVGAAHGAPVGGGINGADLEARARAVHPAIGAVLDFFQDASDHDKAG